MPEQSDRQSIIRRHFDSSTNFDVFANAEGHQNHFNPAGLRVDGAWAVRQIAIRKNYINATFAPFRDLAFQVGRGLVRQAPNGWVSNIV